MNKTCSKALKQSKPGNMNKGRKVDWLMDMQTCRVGKRNKRRYTGCIKKPNSLGKRHYSHQRARFAKTFGGNSSTSNGLPANKIVTYNNHS